MDIKFQHDNNIFSFRVVGVIIHSNKILMQRVKGDVSWALPGGKCEFNETSIDALKRELFEEIEVKEILSSRLLWVVENFYEKHNVKLHEMSMYYLINIKEDEKVCGLDTFNVQEHDHTLEFKWLNLDNIHNENIKPDFLKTRLNNLGDEIEHIIAIE